MHFNQLKHVGVCSKKRGVRLMKTNLTILATLGVIALGSIAMAHADSISETFYTTATTEGPPTGGGCTYPPNSNAEDNATLLAGQTCGGPAIRSSEFAYSNRCTVTGETLYRASVSATAQYQCASAVCPSNPKYCAYYYCRRRWPPAECS